MAEAVLKARATLDASNYNASLGKMKASTDAFAKGMSGGRGGVGILASLGLSRFAVGAAGAGAAAVLAAKKIAEFSLEQAQSAALTTRSANAIGINAGLLEELGDAAERTGASGEGFQQKIAKLVDSQEEALNGNKQMQDSFAALGVSMSQLKTLGTDQLLLAVAQGAQTSSTAVSDLNNLLGKGAGVEFRATLSDLAANGLPKATDEVNRQVEAFSRLNSKWVELKDNISEGFRGGLLNVAQALGIAPKDYELDAKIRERADRRAIEQRNKALEAERKIAAQKAADIAKIEKEQEKKSRPIKENVDALKAMTSTGAEVTNEATAKARTLIEQKITVETPKAADALARIGGAIGGQASAQLSEIRRQTTLLEMLVVEQSKLEQIQRDTAERIADLNQ